MRSNTSRPATGIRCCWLQADRRGWGIEYGSHRPLDISLKDDRSRVRSTNGPLILGMLRRVVLSLFIHWRTTRRKPRQKSLTNFLVLMGEDNLASTFAFVTHRNPKLS